MFHIENLTKEYPTKTLFDQASAHLRPDTRVGIVGPNGTGKTTLLRIIHGTDEPDEGRVRKRPHLKIGYLPQELETLPGRTIIEATHRNEYPEHEAKRILAGLGMGEGDWERSMHTLSGGYRMRVALAHLLLSEPDVLMLDEPTNHLDQATQAWLENFLLSARMTLVMISHDTAFLDRMVTHIWELRNYTIQEYRGDYTTFQKLRAERDAQEAAAANRQAKEVARVQTFVDRFRYQANKASQVQSRIKQLEKVKLIERKRDGKRIRFKFPEPSPSGKQVIELQNIHKAYGEKVIYDGIDFSVARGQKVALVGENGAGKSTLLKILAGVLEFEQGARTLGHEVTVHYFAQHQAEILNPEHSILDSLEEAAPRAERNFLRSIAGVFLFSGDDQKKPIKALSGGERNRVALARMLIEPANTLLLDEPTNHLDPTSVDVLTDALTTFPGTIVFISHDPVFLSRAATRVVEIDEGKARDYIGDYEYYLWKRAQEWESIKQSTKAINSAKPTKHHTQHKQPKGQTAKASPAPLAPPGPSRRELSKTVARLEKQVSKAEEEITRLEERIGQRDKELADPSTYQDYSRWNTLHQERETWGRELEKLTTKWSELSTKLESSKSQFEEL
ncbi:MAG: ABC transporter ATP-binding protein [Nitrospirales bacterium]|nr:MAG: ABC transporter ATP-binding protein [Nitrospirales bacterium]